MRRVTALLLSAAMITTGCASTGGTHIAGAPQPAVVDSTAMADYVQRLPAGSKVRVERTDGASLRGTLMKTGGDAIVVQRTTRLPEPPVDVPIAQIARVTLEGGHGTTTAKAVAIGIASGVGAFFAVLAIAFATIDD